METVHACQVLVSFSQRSLLKTSIRKLVSLSGGDGSWKMFEMNKNNLQYTVKNITVCHKVTHEK